MTLYLNNCFGASLFKKPGGRNTIFSTGQGIYQATRGQLVSPGLDLLAKTEFS